MPERKLLIQVPGTSSIATGRQGNLVFMSVNILVTPRISIMVTEIETEKK